MTTEQQDVLNYIDSLRKEYAEAQTADNKDGMADILEEIEHLTQVNKLVKCRLEKCKRLMFNDTLDPNWPFHSALCHKRWADANYGPLAEPKKRKSVDEMRRQLNDMAKQEHLNKITGKHQNLYD